uniref:Uncharacterized protein n=1 Tax=Anguilla anguilla TaxID=7936 RepID=A0A0E9T9X7_ANGAN
MVHAGVLSQLVTLHLRCHQTA